MLCAPEKWGNAPMRVCQENATSSQTISTSGESDENLIKT